jgi:RNA polymerase sigma-70 factor, ECF subfamily
MARNIFIEQLKNKDAQALNALVKEYQDKVFRICLGYLQNEHDAADVTQEVFIKALEKIDQYKGEAKISTWMIRIAINMSLNYLRDNKKRLLHTELSGLNLEDESPDTYQGKETWKMIRKAIYNLPDKQKKVFILSYYMDYSYQQVSEVTGYTISSIESLLFRARKRLRESLAFLNNKNGNKTQV